MPHRTGDPILCMSENQKRVHKAYGSVPVWLTVNGALQCTYCNSGAEGCQPSCLMGNVMNNMRADVSFLDGEMGRKGLPVLHEEMEDNFHRFCSAPDVQSLVSGERLYADFAEGHRIVLVLQGLGPWLKKEADRYAAAGGVHNHAQDRLTLKCERAVAHFLRLELDKLSEEDTVILSNVIESSGIPEAFDPSNQSSVSKVLDLLSIVNAVKEMQQGAALLSQQQQSDQGAAWAEDVLLFGEGPQCDEHEPELELPRQQNQQDLCATHLQSASPEQPHQQPQQQLAPAPDQPAGYAEELQMMYSPGQGESLLLSQEQLQQNQQKQQKLQPLSQQQQRQPQVQPQQQLQQQGHQVQPKQTQQGPPTHPTLMPMHLQQQFQPSHMPHLFYPPLPPTHQQYPAFLTGFPPVQLLQHDMFSAPYYPPVTGRHLVEQTLQQPPMLPQLSQLSNEKKKLIKKRPAQVNPHAQGQHAPKVSKPSPPNTVRLSCVTPVHTPPAASSSASPLLSANSSSKSPFPLFEDDEPGVIRCRGHTKAGTRCKLTVDSVKKLNGRCAEAAEPLLHGALYCNFHKDQELLF